MGTAPFVELSVRFLDPADSDELHLGGREISHVLVHLACRHVGVIYDDDIYVWIASVTVELIEAFTMGMTKQRGVKGVGTLVALHEEVICTDNFNPQSLGFVEVPQNDCHRALTRAGQTTHDDDVWIRTVTGVVVAFVNLLA